MYEDILRQAGLKITRPRLKILSVLHHPTQHHWHAESIKQALHSQNEVIALATVYRVLSQFEQCGLVQRHIFENDVNVFELNPLEHHDHLVCLSCGTVEEFFDPVIEQHQENIAKRFNFHMSDHRLIIYGLCVACIP
jgi:Fur family transcriptional regulator, ferric uptake regulator